MAQSSNNYVNISTSKSTYLYKIIKITNIYINILKIQTLPKTQEKTPGTIPSLSSVK